MLPFRIALRYLFARKRHSAVNIISWISVAGVCVATAAIVCVLSVFNGFSDLARTRLSAIDPEIKLMPVAGKSIPDADSIAAALAALPEIKAAAPVVEERALAIHDGVQMPITIKGVPEGYEEIAPVGSTIIDGEFSLGDSILPSIALSVGAAVRLNARPGFISTVRLYAPRRKGRINPANPMAAFRSDTLDISAVYEVQQTDYDLDRAIVPLAVARHLLDYSAEATAIELSVADGVSPSRAMAAVGAAAGSSLKPLSRLMQQQESYRMIAVEKWLTFLMLSFILIIASFNIISTVSMLIIEKKENIATLAALGARPAQIGGIFFWEGWLISLLGGCSGIIIGIALCLAQQWGGFIKLGGDPSQLSISTYPVALQPADILAVGLIVIAVGALIGWITSALSRSAFLSLRPGD